MLIRRIVPFPLILIAFIHPLAAATDYAKLKELYDRKQYFDLRDELSNYDDSSADLLFYRGAVSNKFNRLNSAINHLQNYLKRARGKNDSRLEDCYELLADSYLKSYEYKKAAGVYKTLVAMMKEKGDPGKAFDYENSLRICSALSDVPRQTIALEGDSKITLSRNIVGMQIPIEINGQQVPFIFDTGANISTVTASFAANLGLKIIDTSITVGSITGNTVKSRLAVATAIKIGNATIRNAVFLVFEDKDLFISQINFQINAIIGFPVIEALKEITISHGGEVFIPRRAGRRAEQNMCLDGLTPLLAGTHKGRRLAFTFDTGARTSSLYPPFFKAYEEEIKARGISQPEKITGAGGSKEVPAYRLSDLAMTFSGKEARFVSVKILTQETIDNSRYFYGNLGQDLIRQFEKMTLNFESMSIVFE